jgi:hypothetical protein
MGHIGRIGRMEHIGQRDVQSYMSHPSYFSHPKLRPLARFAGTTVTGLALRSTRKLRSHAIERLLRFCDESPNDLRGGKNVADHSRGLTRKWHKLMRSPFTEGRNDLGA